MGRRFIFAVTLVAWALSACVEAPGQTLARRSRRSTASRAKPGLRLDGTFIQYQPWMMDMDAAAWTRELDAMREAKLRVIVLQYHRNGDQRYFFDESAGSDGTDIILDYADKHHMDVFMGLYTDQAWWKQCLQKAYLDATSATSMKLAERLWRRYGHHRSFVGWYLPSETWDRSYSDDQVVRFRDFFRRLSDHCRAQSPAAPKPVAISPFFEARIPPEQVEKTYTDLLTESGIDIVMLQDGIGARQWGDEVASKIVPYFRAFRNACLSAGVELWSNLECFQILGDQSNSPPGKFIPAHVERIARQMVAAAPFVQRFVTFDFFHYMSPYRNEQARQLNEQYLERFVKTRFVPTFGRSVTIDPVFPYYRDRSPASIAAEVRANGYNIVRYILTADSNVNPALVAALHREHIGVWYLTFGNGTYSTKDLPRGWEAWKMVTRSDLAGEPLKEGYTRLCLNNPRYRAWKKAQIVRTLRRCPFQGVDIVEPHWPEYPGIKSKAYGCFCPHCLAAFTKMFPDESALPDILDPNSPHSPQRNPELWKKWLAFRQASLTDFLNDLVNGRDGIRQRAPQAQVSLWTLALAEDNALKRIREDSGEDAGEIVRVVKPDMHCLQTHWPDWLRRKLPPTYVERYRPFIDQIRKVDRDLPIMIQADIGSKKANRRSWEWIETFEQACNRLGVGSTTAYEYFVGGYMYTDPPQVTEVRRQGRHVELRFTKRLERASATDPGHYDITPGSIIKVQVDGSTVRLSLKGVRPGQPCVLTLEHLADAADRRLFKDRPPAVLESQTLRFRY